MSHFSELWLTFTLCAEARASQRSCWSERKSLCFNRWGFLHFFIHNLQRNKWEFYRRASENLNTGYYPVIHIPLTHFQEYCISASPGSSIEERASAGKYRIQHSVNHLLFGTMIRKTLLWQINKPWSLRRMNLPKYTSFITRAKSGSTINHLHYNGNIDFIFAKKDL